MAPLEMIPVSFQDFKMIPVSFQDFKMIPVTNGMGVATKYMYRRVD
jgi:hypothetical protein